MSQQIHSWRAETSQRAWLSMLIDTMEDTACPEQRAVPCQAEFLAGLRAQLALPAPGGFISRNSLPN